MVLVVVLGPLDVRDLVPDGYRKEQEVDHQEEDAEHKNHFRPLLEHLVKLLLPKRLPSSEDPYIVLGPDAHLHDQDDAQEHH